MKLLLTSAGVYNRSIISSLSNLLKKPFNQASLVYILTASNVEDGDKSWLIDDFVRFQELGFASLDIVDISAVAKSVWYPRLERTDIIVFGGGNEAYLAYWVEKSGLKNILPKLLEKKVYVGISAGSMITADKLSYGLSEKVFGEKIGNYDHSEEGLGFVDFKICPHFNSEFFPKNRAENVELLAGEMNETIYTIDDDTAIEVIDNQVRVISEGEWKRFN